MSKIKEMAKVFARTPRMNVGTVPDRLEAAYLEGALFALQEAASDLLQDDHPKNGRSHRKDRVYAAWLRERAIKVGDD